LIEQGLTFPERTPLGVEMTLNCLLKF
jgi:hypothetical protein